MKYDFRSDTVTRPTAGMRDAMFSAPVGDDVYGEDPTVNALEEKVAALLGKEAALFVPSGTMANQLAIHLHCRPGDSVLIEEDSHCFIYEGGAGAALSGVQFDQISFSDNWSEAAIRRKFRASDLHSARTRLMVMENTHNRNGGVARSPEEVTAGARVGRALGLALHCDGARLWNAAARFGVPEKTLAAPFDSVAVCFSKGLGAPVGSALVGARGFIDEARRIRKRWGGGMRQAGFLAAAAVFALDHQRQRLSDDHRSAAMIADGLRELVGRSRVVKSLRDIASPTNMIYVQLAEGAAGRVVAAGEAAGVRFHHLGGDQVRLVTHLDLPAGAAERAVEFFKGLND